MQINRPFICTFLIALRPAAASSSRWIGLPFGIGLEFVDYSTIYIGYVWYSTNTNYINRGVHFHKVAR